jgi:Putative peptidoglycan binding domain
MWIWYVSRSEGGSTARILARAHRSGIGTVYIKAGDGSGIWSQFSTPLVQALHQGGLDVCAWQFVYADAPIAEAKVGAAAVAKGADCLVIDAESQYEGKYAAAETYIRALRARIASSFPVSLAGFPYVDYHPAFPYSVFFGPGGAGYNQPQMYWKAIGTSVRTVFEHTYVFNRLWGHPIYPLGQTYESPGRGAIEQFRSFAQSYGGAPSWWDWQETNSRTWGALGTTPAGPVAGYHPVVSQPVLRRGSRGDLVVWAQEHLRSAGQPGLAVTGVFGNPTYTAVRTFQSARGLRADGVIGDSTWSALLDFSPAQMHWAGRAGASSAGATISRAAAISASRPRSASLPAKAYEIPVDRRP